jgi:hypothetical protein
MISVAPHDFEPMGRFGARKRSCRGCYLPLGLHPTRGWTRARPYVHRRWWH